MSNHFDFLVLGGGSAGYAAASFASAQGKKVAVVDGSEELGGLCILRGCMPSKTLIYSAEVLHLAHHAESLGLTIPEAAVDMKALHQRKLQKIDEFAQYRREQLESDRFTLFRHHGKFIGKKEIELDDGTRLSADKILIATGSLVSVPNVPGLADAHYWTSDDVLDLDFVPESVVVLGGGIVACELAQFLQRIGTKVTMIQRSPRILKEASAEAAAVIEKVFHREGIELFTDTKLEQVQQYEDGFQVTFQHEGETKNVQAKHLFNALGRKPNTSQLNLGSADILAAPSGHIKTNKYQQTANPDVYAAGDCVGPYEIVHVAIMQGELAAKHSLGIPAEPINYDQMTGIIFTDPQVAYVGAAQTCHDHGCLLADYPFDDHGKSITMDATDGYVKLWAKKECGQIISAECVHRDAAELIHSMAVAVTLGIKADQLLKVHWYHPTLSEIWTYPIEDIVDALQA